jgi:NADP-dependent 3-hydroxy acid dehydrogenase YdfG
MSQPSTWPRAFEQAFLRPAIRRFKKILGIGRISAVARRVDQLSAVEPRVTQLEAVPSRIDVLERRIEELEALCREQVGLQYLQLAAGSVESPSDVFSSQRRAK